MIRHRQPASPAPARARWCPPIPATLHATDVVKFFGDRRGLDGITLTAPPGRRIGLIGENGAGKTTLLHLLADPPHLLLLDEPTNHLSLTLAEELETALDHTPGAAVIASHDRRRSRWRHHRLDL